jgi:Protein of unknown function (DUF2961)
MQIFGDPSRIDLGLDSRSISFENPTGARGQGGTAAGGRKGAPNRRIAPGETVVLADIEGPGRVRHIWMTFMAAPPEEMRAVVIEGFYDGRAEPSLSVPALDFFGLPHGRTVACTTGLTAVQEGRGFNAYYPMPFRRQLRLSLTNHGKRAINFYYQVDYTLEPIAEDAGCLHVTFRRENPTVLKRDFTIAEGIKGPGRFLGCVVGVRVLPDDMVWYGEGEFKFYRDGDTTHPTYCGTGLEDYVGSAWGMGAHATPYQGAPLIVAPPADPQAPIPRKPDFVGFYRWHIPDPMVFEREMRATIQQIGALLVPKGAEHLMEDWGKRYTLAGNGWVTGEPLANSPLHAFAIAERVDDYCAAAFVYAREPQSVPRLDVAGALADIGRREHERKPRGLAAGA